MHATPSSPLRATVPAGDHGFPALLRIWVSIGFQSFGGGSTTLFLIRRAMVTERNWISEQEFNRYWVLVQVAPGINLIALAILIGQRLAGVPGILACLIGLLMPSALITVLLTAGFATVQDLPQVRAALRGVLPATAGLSLALGLEMARPLLKRSRGESTLSVAYSISIICTCAILVAVWKVSAVLLLVAAGILGAFVLTRYEAREPQVQQ